MRRRESRYNVAEWDRLAGSLSRAGDKQVTVVGGANTAQQCLRAGPVDEIHMGIIPILLGEGLRFFEPFDSEQMELEKTRVFESPMRTDLWFRVIKENSN